MGEYAARMRQVVEHVEPLLRKRGYTQRGHAFMRRVDDDVTHAITFQAGRFELAEERRPGLHGSFTLECGVWLRAVADLRSEQAPAFVRSYDCHVRQRAGMLLPEREDTWWRLDGDTDVLGVAMAGLLEDVVLPWLEALASAEAVLSAHASGDATLTDHIVMPPLVVAELERARGDSAAATAIVRAELGKTQHRPAAEHLVAWAQSVGLDVSMEDATIVNMLAAERAEWT
jgi:hypothetical protein